MENASKALLIAGEVLIAMLVASMMVLLFSTMSSYADEHAEQRRIQEVQAFNANVTQYAKASDCTAQDIVSLVNFAKQINQQLGCELVGELGNVHNSHMKIHVNISGKGTTYHNMEKQDDTQLREFLTNYSVPGSAIKYYTASINNYFGDGRIQEITFDEQP